MSSPLSITLEECGHGKFVAKTEESGTRYAGLLDDTSCSANTPDRALAGMAEAVRMAELVIEERRGRGQG